MYLYRNSGKCQRWERNIINLHGIMFHHFYDDKIHIRGQGAISAQEFENIIDFYSRDFEILPADEYYLKAKQGILTDKETCITFDDGLKCQYDIAYPVLSKLGLTAFYFIYSSPLEGVLEKLEIYRHFRFFKFKDIEDFYSAFFKIVKKKEELLSCDIKNKMERLNLDEYLKEFSFYTPNDKRFRYLRNDILGTEKYNYLMEVLIEEYDYDVNQYSKYLWMSKDDIKTLYKAGNMIGLHSHSHPIELEKFGYNQQFEEYSRNKTTLEKIIENRVSTVSYPCNSYNEDTLAIMKKIGVDLGFRANMEMEYTSLLEVPRTIMQIL